MTSLRNRWPLLALLAAAGVLVVPALVAFRSFRAEARGFIPSRHPPRKSLAEFDVPALQVVSFTARAGNRLRGFFAPSINGASVVLTHGTGGDRSDLADEAKILSAAGFGVLTFDWPGHGESEGPIRWGQPEREALVAALDWLQTQPTIDAARIGGFGFSMGGYIVAQVAATDARLKVAALAGTPHDPVEQTLWEYRRWGVIAQWPAMLAIRRAGMRLNELVPERVVGQIAPRPVLIISGNQDDTVPPWMSQRLFDAAGEPKRLLHIPGAGHGGYGESAPGSYPQDLLQFFAKL